MKKICKRCGVEKEIDEFYKHKQTKDGYLNICIECKLKEKEKYYFENRQKILKDVKNYREKNKEQVKQTKKICYEKNKEHYKERDKNYYKENKESIIERCHNYYHSHKKQYKERIKERRLSGEFYFRDADKRHKRRAQQKETDITESWLLQLKEESINCPLCGKIMIEIKEPYHPDQKQLDHIIPLWNGGKHFKNNVRYIC